ncbi:NAD(P)H-hydrate dehydratase [Pedobacter boryungensis]|uniref:Bifunctional NAD(P)H-hydrate repair enzyme n=1 Tax=Pedobacter boryungensis TaxID=869962 RepID=A0ABX2DEQ4_9SPHI|nr:NAD(P)H-hydrate dehydratase [Pedobacter boryungensis]NQX32567.1 NAD(P)H-hydrate dehydratase [Pedobacter boryungensis]
MKNLLTSSQMRNADAYTIKHQSISSINLMEKAAKAFVKVFKKEVPNKEARISILCGQGNNGGDGLAIARLLYGENYKEIAVYLIDFSENQSEDNKKNIKRLLKFKIPVVIIKGIEELKNLQADIIVDAILGSGLNKPLQGNYADTASFVNDLNAKVIAVDVPTGFNSEGGIAEKYSGIKADLTICFQRPKINFFFPESVKALSRFKVVDIGLDENFIENQKSEWKLTTEQGIKKLIKPRKNFSHKGTYGHALIVAGNNTTMGAALLAASACIHSGAGLTTVCLPQSGLIALNTSLPEAMALPRNQHLAMEAFDKLSAIAVGPGLGIEEENEEILEKLVNLRKPLVLDADALTLLSQRGDLLYELPAQSILTPHMKEFDRLFGEHKNWWKRVETARREAVERGLIFVLKNQYTFVCLPDGDVHINSTGNPAMASGGMGDVLTGIITGLMAQSYSSADAAILGAYLHGKAGDELAKKRFTVSASQLALQIPKTIKRIIK